MSIIVGIDVGGSTTKIVGFAPDGGLHACAAGSGLMRYDEIFRFVQEKKPFIHMTLEDTRPENAEQAREFCVRGLMG